MEKGAPSGTSPEERLRRRSRRSEWNTKCWPVMTERESRPPGNLFTGD